MSVRAMSWVWDHSPYSDNTLLMHLALADWADDEGKCWPSQERIGQKVRCTVESVRRMTRRMEADGLLSITPGGGRGRSSMYRLVMKPPQQEGGLQGMETPTTEGGFTGETPTTEGQKPPQRPSVEPPVEPELQGTSYLPLPMDSGDTDPFGRALVLVQDEPPRMPSFGAVFAAEWKALHDDAAPQQMIRRVARDAKALVVKEDRDPERVAEACRYAAQLGHANVASAYGQLASRETRTDPFGRPSRNERAMDEAQSLIERAAARDAARERKGIGS